MNLVIDASVAMKWFFLETGTQAALSLQEGSDRLFAPDLLKIEVGNNLVRGIRRGVLKRADADAAMAKLTLPAVDLVETGKLIDDAYTIAAQHGGSLYDATYMALARNLAGQLVTADLQMMAVARKAKVKARLIA
ncbi:MAG: type II toxin-antitoxin system VapC family toxin [Rhodospirillaceae bacterium]|nr:type II toxin-antitoxin system VapC family toxin [Rhodospirillaceae bacterium]